MAALASLVVMSCSEEGTQELPNNINSVAITSSQINHASDSRVWKSNDRVGIYQFNGESIVADNIEYCNVAYDGDGANFKAVNSDEALEYISDAAQIVAYYPYNADVVGGVLPLDLSTQIIAERVDLIVADRTTLLKDESNDVEFVHKLAMLRFNLILGDDIAREELVDVELSLSGLYVAGEYDIVADAIDFNSDMMRIESVKSSDGGNTIDLVVMPQSVGRIDLTLQGSLSGRYEESITIGGDLPTAELYEYDLTVNKSGLTISSPTISPWGDSGLSTGGDVIDVTGNSYFDVADPEIGYYYYADGTWSSVEDLPTASLGGIKGVEGMIFDLDETNRIAYILSIEAPFAPCNWADVGYESIDDSATDTSSTYNAGVNTYESNTGAQNMYAVQCAGQTLNPGSEIYLNYPAFKNVHSLNEASIDYSTNGMLYDFWYMTNTAEASVAVKWIVANWDNVNTWFDEGGRSNGSSFPTYAGSRYWGAADNDGAYNEYADGVVTKYRTMSIYPNATGTTFYTNSQIKSVTSNYTLPIMQVTY